jgi:dTDP-4-dehydrorhamnose 3,5-epimerase
MHVHARHDEYYCLVRGRAYVGLRDIRPWSTTENVWALFDMSGDDLAFVQFPAGVVHGWYFAEDSVHLQAVSETYARYQQDDNLGCQWSDPALGIPWPQASAHVSEAAAAFPGFEALCRTFRAGVAWPGRGNAARGHAEPGA